MVTWNFINNNGNREVGKGFEFNVTGQAESEKIKRRLRDWQVYYCKETLDNLVYIMDGKTKEAKHKRLEEVQGRSKCFNYNTYKESILYAIQKNSVSAFDKKFGEMCSTTNKEK